MDESKTGRIGRGIALTLAASGAEVIVNDKNPTTGQETAQAIQRSGGSSRFLEADVSDPRAVEAMFQAISQDTPALHLLVNNAGFNLFKGIQETCL